MTTLALPQAHPLPAPASENYLKGARGIRSWLFTLDHKRIGVMYLFSTFGAMLLGGVFALLIRTELLTPGPTIVSHDTYNKLFTLHGAVMIFLFIIPAIPGALGNFVLPVMLGAKDVAFPRLNLLSYYLWLGGAVFMLTSMWLGAIDTGWTFYAPYSTTTPTAVVSSVLGVFILGFSSILTGINFIATVHKLRPLGMTWFKMPLFVWAIYSTALVQVLATPVLAITLLLLFLDRVLGIPFFDPALGGDPVLFQHFFWFYSHPAVYIMILPAMGIESELISAFSHKEPFGYRFIAYSSLAIALLGSLVWGHHMFVSGQSPLASVIFSAITFTVAVPSAIKIFNWLATMYKGSISLKTPMLYALGFLFLFGIGGLTGLFLGALATDVHLHDTYFVVAHFHYVMVGGTIMALFGGVHYWWPKIFGRMYNETLGRITALLIIVGFNVTFFPQFLLGTRGMPRRYYDYLPQFQGLHVTSSIGAYLLGFGIALMCSYLVYSLFRGAKAPQNPWGATTLEWSASSPPRSDNFARTPVAREPYDYSRLQYDLATGGYVESLAASP
jgi:cytochrome c oxidase subunit 1